MIIRCLIVPLTVAAFAVHAGQALAQGAFPALLPGQADAPASNASPLPPVNGAAASALIGGATAPLPSNGATSGTSDTCMKGFFPLREEAEKRGKLIKAASERHAPPDEACKLIANFGQSEIEMIKYIEANWATCGIPPQIAVQIKAGHKNTEAMQTKVCMVAQQAQTRGPSLNEVLGPQNREPAGPVGDFWPASTR